eukprot:TRINITY_DN8245_c0_g1_i1.p1 TRINITY_DN8245_c0_g1~~TRINITY_DN8245_c0_g1_i1.p1  ORF type:complete len:248 (-),score=51.14 TRINITY_DN8245_c0_g1_i1:232-975(-)
MPNQQLQRRAKNSVASNESFLQKCQRFLSIITGNRRYLAILSLISAFSAFIVWFYLRNRVKRTSNAKTPSNQSNISSSSPIPSHLNPQSKSSPVISASKSLSGLKIVLCTSGILFQKKKNAKDELVIIPTGASAIIKLLGQNDVYLLTQVDSDEEELQINRILDETGILWAGLNPSKSLFCSQSKGKVHMVRQLEAHLYADDDYEVINDLKPFVPHLLYISPNLPQKVEDNISVAKTLADFIWSFHQ